MRFSQLSSAVLLSSTVSISVSAQGTYGKGKPDIIKGGSKSQYIPGRFIVEFAKPTADNLRTAEDVSYLSPYIITIGQWLMCYYYSLSRASTGFSQKIISMPRQQ